MEHNTYVIVNEEAYDVQGACSCGWRGGVYGTEISASADDEANEHEESV
jgi:hypothetical protein